MMQHTPYFVWTNERVAKAKELAHSGLTSPEIAAAMGTTKGSVLGRLWREGVTLTGVTIRKDRPIKRPKRGSSEETLALYAAVKREYIDAGRSATEVGRELGIPDNRVRQIAYNHGWKKSAEVVKQNTIRGNKQHRAKVRSFVMEKRVGKSDEELIAEYMAKGTVTKLPDGIACGITTWEQSLHTAYPTPAFNPKNFTASNQAKEKAA